jgi:hypothetical protein
MTDCGHRVARVMIEAPEHGIRTKPFAPQKASRPQIALRVGVLSGSVQCPLHMADGDIAHRPAPHTVPQESPLPLEFTAEMRMPHAVFRKPIRDDGHAVHVATIETDNPQDVLDGEAMKSFADALDASQTLFGDRSHDPAIVEKRRRRVVRR